MSLCVCQSAPVCALVVPVCCERGLYLKNSFRLIALPADIPLARVAPAGVMLLSASGLARGAHRSIVIPALRASKLSEVPSCVAAARVKLEERRALLGSAHPSTLTAIQTLACLLEREGCETLLSEARALETEAKESFRALSRS